MQLWEIDFSGQQSAGKYYLNVQLNDAQGQPLATLNSEPFEIATYQVTRRVLPAMTWTNASARAAVTDQQRHMWNLVSGTAKFHSDLQSLALAPSGAIDLTGDRDSGAVLVRTPSDWGDCPANPPPGFNPNPACNFTLIAQMELLRGCDAQMQFHITDGFRYGVTLQSGKCGLGTGPGAIRLHKEGLDVPDPFHFHEIASKSFPVLKPLAFNHPYLVKINVVGTHVNVYVDDELMITENIDAPAGWGSFALKAWGSEARFDYVQAWNWRVDLQPGPRHAPIPSVEFSDAAGARRVHCDDKEWPLNPDLKVHPELHDVCHPIFAQLHGFHDCNNIIGEANSHGVFLNGLVNLWAARSRSRRGLGAFPGTPTISGSNQDKLKTAILTAVDYLNVAYRQQNGTGQFAHEEWGRSSPEAMSQYNTELAVYGLSAFAAFASEIDPERARRSCVQSARGMRWLETSPPNNPETEVKAVVYAQVAICIKQLQLEQDSEIASAFANTFGFSPADASLALAIGAVNDQLNDLGQTVFRSAFMSCTKFSKFNQQSLRTTPIFEGVYLLKTQFASAIQSELPRWDPALKSIKEDLIANIAFKHGFEIVPQTDARPAVCWPDTTYVPQPAGTALPVVGDFWYVNTQIATSAIDVLLLTKITDDNSGLERIATASLGWITGLGPGLPAYKTINPECKPSQLNNDAWLSAAFIRGLDTRFAQGFVNFLDPTNPSSGQAKSWFSCWETSREAASGRIPPDVGGQTWKDSPSSEVWWVDPLNNGFMTVLNGYVIDDGSWRYHNEGEYGWHSGETFILDDGLFVKAAVLYEDYLAPESILRRAARIH